MAEGDTEDLLREAAEGNRGAANEIARRYEAPLRAAIRGRLDAKFRARIDTDDLVQSTIAAALEDLEGLDYRGEQAFLAWLRKIAERRVRMAVRRHRAGMRDAGRERPIDAAAAVHADRTSPGEAAQRQEMTATLRRALAEMPELDRQVVEMHSFQGRSFREVAEWLGLPGEEAARRVFRRALKGMGDRM